MAAPGSSARTLGTGTAVPARALCKRDWRSMSRFRTGSRPGTHDLTTTSCPVLATLVEYTRLDVPPVMACTGSTSAFRATPTLRVSSASSIGERGHQRLAPRMASR